MGTVSCREISRTALRARQYCLLIVSEGEPVNLFYFPVLYLYGCCKHPLSPYHSYRGLICALLSFLNALSAIEQLFA